jgi:serine/threonine protein kinase
MTSPLQRGQPSHAKNPPLPATIDCLYCDEKEKWLKTELKTVVSLHAQNPTAMITPSKKEYQEDYIPIVYAVRYAAQVDIVKYMFEQHPMGIKWRNRKDASTLLHYAAYDDNSSIVPFLLMMYPDACLRKKTNGKTPLELARTYRRTKCIEYLEHPYFTVCEYFRDTHEHMKAKAETLFPNSMHLLHYSIIFGELDLIHEIFEEHRAAVHATRSFDNTCAIHHIAQKNFGEQGAIWLPLFESMVCEGPNMLVQKDDVGETPLHYIAEQALCSIQFDFIRLSAISCPKAAEVMNSRGYTPLHLIADIDYDTQDPPNDDTQSLHFSITKTLHSAMDEEFKDNYGNDPTDIVRHKCEWPRVSRWARCLGSKYGKYKLSTNSKPIYRSKTCEVYIAKDVEDKDAPVCLKIIRVKDYFITEKMAREKTKLSSEYIIEVKNFIRQDEALHFKEDSSGEQGKHSVPTWLYDTNAEEYCVVMELGDRNLNTAICDDRFAGFDGLMVRIIGSNIAKSLEHLHANGLLHGDVKPRNVVQCGTSWKLIDLDACCDIEGQAGIKYSSGYAPPELGKLIFTSRGAPVNRGSHALLAPARPTYDIWAFGALFYLLCSGRPLFAEIDSSDDNLFDEDAAKCLRNWSEIDNRRLSFVFQEKDDDDDDKILAKDLLRKCLRGDPNERLQSMHDILEHPFFAERAKAVVLSATTEIGLDSTVGTRGGGRKPNKATNEFAPSSMYPDGSYAVIVAIDDYDNDGVPVDLGGMKSLKCAVADANLMKSKLVDQGFEIFEELINEQATSTKVKEMFDNVRENMKGKTHARFLFFLASHGYLDDENDESWMCCYGCNINKLSSTCVDLNEFKKLATRLNVGHQLYILDCCHAGGLFAGTRGAPTKYETAMMKSPAVYGMTAVTEAQEALEAHGHGLFTKSIANALDGGSSEFQRGEPYMTAAQLFSYASRSVFEEASRQSHEQTPKFEPLLQMHKKKSCDGQYLFFADSSNVASVASPKAQRHQKSVYVVDA